jgi:AcrR family transcriptional regulator
MPVREGDRVGRRRRRTPEAAQREIIDAAEALLHERPFRDMTVDEVMRRTGLSRPSFYVYFKDRHELVLRIVQHLAAELLVVANRWYEATGHGPDLLRDALRGIVTVYGEHGAVLRALADAAVDDQDVERAYTTLLDGFIDATASHIAKEIDAGQGRPLDPQETAKALIWMAERYLYHCYGPDRRVPPDKVVDTLHTIMVRTLYAA